MEIKTRSNTPPVLTSIEFFIGGGGAEDLNCDGLELYYYTNRLAYWREMRNIFYPDDDEALRIATLDIANVLELEPATAEATDMELSDDEINESHHKISKSLIQISMDSRDYVEALRIANVFIANVNSADSYNYRGLIFATIGKFEEANIDFTTAIKLNPNDKIYYSNRGSFTLMAKGDSKMALADLLKCKELAPEFDKENIAFKIVEAENRVNGNPANDFKMNPEIQIHYSK